MDLNELVATIVRQVLEQLQKGSPSIASGLPTASVRPCLMLLAPRSEELAAKVREISGEQVNLCFFGENSVSSGVPTRYVLPFLACGEMAELAAGKASGTFLQEALRFLLAGTEVEVIEFEYRSYANTAPAPLYNLYAAYEKTLATYGMVEFKAKRPELVQCQETLVTEKTVSQAHEDGAYTLVVAPSAIITPLARDAAKSLNVNILKGPQGTL